MGKFISAVDGVFAVLIPDEVGRFFCLHLPFWSLLVWIGWDFGLNSGLWIIWAGVVFVAIPGLMAVLSHEIYKSSQDEPSFANGWVTMFRAWCAVYAILVLSLIGIPGWYFGGVMELVQTKTFALAYRWVLVAWWKLFHFYQSEYKVKDINQFLPSYAFNFVTWQGCFLFSAVAIAPALFIWLYFEEKKKAELLAREEARLEKEAAAKCEREEIQRAKAEAQRVAYEKRLAAQIEAEKEEKRKLQAKINEVKGKDPWDSGFL